LKQVRQYLKSGELDMSEIPVPFLGAGDVLVRTHYSFVSVGTEKMKVTQARMSLVQKAKERPDQVRQVVTTLREQGVMPTFRKVQERLRTPATLGYSCAGVVEAVGSQVDGFRVGDRVACIGEGLATHAEFNAVPRNLVVPVPAGVSLEAASSSAIGAIAIQSIRQAKLELGETVAIVGLGLLGQFLVQLCRANGVRVVGVDLDPSKCELAISNGADSACGPDMDEALRNASRVSGGSGVDCVMLTVSTKDIAPIELAATLVRDRGRVVCLGNTAIELDWRTWFGKEIDFLFSRAMGAGMYDPDYLMRGKDYPVGYVRWTANRNIQAFLDLIEQRRIDVQKLITHRYAFGEAKAVFDQIASGVLSKAVGIVFEYSNPERGAFEEQPRTVVFSNSVGAGSDIVLGQIGAGNYAKSMLMPHYAALRGLALGGICTTKGANADALARRYGFARATVDASELIGDPSISAILVATRHDTHARFAREALTAGKHVYVEKPLAVSSEQLDPILAALPADRTEGPTLWLGHNRRFSPLSVRVAEHFRGVEVRQVICTVRTAGVPADSWYQDPAEGGGILFGDVCHFIDLAIYFSESLPVEVSALATTDPSHRDESWSIQVRFANGGLGVVHYVCGSNEGWERETVDVFGGGRSAHLAGFKSLELRQGRKRTTHRLIQPDLGQKTMLEAMVAQFSRAAGAKDYTESFAASAQALVAAHRSIKEGRIVRVEPRFPFALR